MGYERFLGPEIFFNPEIFSSDFTVPLPDVVDEAICRCPIDTRRGLYKNIVLSGGTTMFKSFGKRLERDIKRRVDTRLDANVARLGERHAGQAANKIDVNVITHQMQRFAVTQFGVSLRRVIWSTSIPRVEFLRKRVLERCARVSDNIERARTESGLKVPFQDTLSNVHNGDWKRDLESCESTLKLGRRSGSEAPCSPPRASSRSSVTPKRSTPGRRSLGSFFSSTHKPQPSPRSASKRARARARGEEAPPPPSRRAAPQRDCCFFCFGGGGIRLERQISRPVFSKRLARIPIFLIHFDTARRYDEEGPKIARHNAVFSAAM